MTATRAALLELATRCKQASGPDRDLDAEIGAVGLKDGVVRYTTDGHRCLQVSPLPRRFTASLDAALTLVPAGWRFSVDNLNRAGPLAICEPARGAYVRSECSTPALALCAAAFRALAAEAPQ